MTRYVLNSALVHAALIAFFLFSPWFRSRPPALLIDGFDYLGSGGGGDGRSAGGGPRPENVGQVVPAPVKVPLPQKPAPVQKATVGEETWKVKNAREKKETKPVARPADVPRGERTQSETSNIIRRGVDPNEKAGQGGFDFGPDEGGKGKGLGIGFGPGTGGGFGGFGSYLRVLRQRIWAEWTQTAVYGSKNMCIVGLTVARSGQIEDIRLEKSSGDGFYDNVALRAVRNASPLPPLPTSFPDSEQRFRIQFRLLD